jgi:putative tryptophan/tyrosine transport system substrate-binding protein
MNRRDILAMFGGTLFLGGPLVTRAQTPSTIRHIGALVPGVRAPPAELQRIWAPSGKLGWVVGQNLIVEERYTGGNAELLRPMAEELVQRNVEIIVTVGEDSTRAAKNATSRIPIVMYTAGDPVRAGLVASLAKPGGNVTGFSIVSPDLDVKRLAFLRELLPTAQLVGVLVNRADPLHAVERERSEQVYRSFGMKPIFFDVAGSGEFEGVVAEAARRRVQALVVPVDILFGQTGAPIMRAALRHVLPTIVGDADLFEAGGLLSLTTDEDERNDVLAYFVDKILRGAIPADLPVQQPTKFRLGINMKSAKALGITVPQSLLLRADEVIR